MMIKSLQILFLVVALLACATKQERKIQLVHNGQSEYTIALPVSASAEEVRAAEFLQYHVYKISECSLPIVSSDIPLNSPAIYVSISDEITEGDWFRLFTSENDLHILGGNNRGCI